MGWAAWGALVLGVPWEGTPGLRRTSGKAGSAHGMYPASIEPSILGPV